ncbi:MULTISPECIES: hypothetical protein [Pseudomonas]|jgi:hypothetical protein|uniref:hypothetical protein n=1 Tax=Pseudomonas TaxID=286 RepID=UPI000D0CE857|nr:MULTISPECIES: hypothetical protein [Pseudomonas]MBK3511108.1 hypothetical protein [Pseudomonas sp. MF6747]MBT0626129.1 hypothetical protein [Pseudomonas fluorescens]PSL95537.1 hypothetical protein C7U57_06980 [Pseudomonas sp. R9.37]QJI12796.1 hypothetical protein HKK58_09740 [Pseudomonas sp. ADAK22]
MAWRQQNQNCAWVAGEAPYVFANEYTANFISGFRTVLIAKVEGEGVGNQPFGKFFNDADGHAEANFLEALRANDWVFDAGYQEIVVSINNSPCRQCCVLFKQFMEDILLRFPNTRLVIETANIYHPNDEIDQGCLRAISRLPGIRVEMWNVALENAQNRGPQVDQQKELARINKSLRTANVVRRMP